MFGSSQGFGHGDLAPTQDAQKRTRPEDKQTCIPVTVRILQDAVQRHSDSQQILIHGVEASIVHLVGVVEAMVQQAAMLEFQLNDGSGRMKVRFYTSDTNKMEGLAIGCYVSVVGNLRTAPTAHLSAMNLQASISADTVSYHMIDVAHAALRLRNPSAAAGLQAIPLSATTTPMKQPMLGLGVGPMMSPVKVEATVTALEPALTASMQAPPKVDLRIAVVEALRQAQETAAEEGMSVSSLIAALAPAHATSDKVKDILSQLVEEGDVFTTIDDDHFSII